MIGPIRPGSYDMGIREKIIALLSDAFKIDYVRLEDDEGITGFVVSADFSGVTSFDRQEQLENALINSASSAPLTREDYRKILMIACLTPEEYDTVGAKINVHKIKELGNRSFEILLHGGYSDAQYLRKAFDNETGYSTTEPKQPPGAIGVLMKFRVKRSEPATKADIIRTLRNDKYIQLVESI